MSGLDVTLVAPFPLESGRGNAVAAGRIAHLLRGAGHRVTVRLAGADEPVAMDTDVVVALHALHAGAEALRVRAASGAPLVVSFRGTDVDPGLSDPASRAAIARVLDAATAVTALSDAQATRLAAAFPRLTARIHVIPHSVTVTPRSRAACRARLGLPEGVPVIAHVAGVRGVKGFPGVEDVIDAVHAAHPTLRYVHAGAVLDARLGARFATWVADRPWARSLGEVTREQALDLLAAADVSFHWSAAEGLSNALLESLALRVPAVVRDGAAARAVVTDGVDSRIVDDPAGAVRAITELLADPARARRLGDAAADMVARRFSAAAETAAYDTVLRLAVTRRSDGGSSA